MFFVDDSANETLVKQILDCRPDCELIAVSTATEGLDLARQRTPDLILLDLHLPDMDGPSILRELRALKNTREVPVVILTPDPRATREKIPEGSGDVLMIATPINIPEFLNTMDEVLV